MKIICISGHAQHGKDTSASVLKAHLEADGYRVLITHYADLLKFICTSFFGWDGRKDERGRSLLQHIGSEVVRAKRPNYWVDFMLSIFDLFESSWDYVIIPDCRFPNEIDELRSHGFDVTTMRIVRPNFASPLTAEQMAHPSETALDNYPFDYTIENAGSLGELSEALSKWILEVNGFHQQSFTEI